MFHSLFKKIQLLNWNQKFSELIRLCDARGKRPTPAPWSQLESVGVSWSQLESVGVSWSQLESVGVSWSLMESHGITWSYLESYGVTWSPSKSLLELDITVLSFLSIEKPDEVVVSLDLEMNICHLILHHN